MKRLITVLLSMALILCSCGKNSSDELSWQEQYDLGVRYLSEGNYEEAIIAFTAAIEIDPKQAAAYMGQAEAYIALEEVELAIEILQKGFDQTADPSLNEKIKELQNPTDNLSWTLTDSLISQEDFLLGGVPFYELTLEQAKVLLPYQESIESFDSYDENDNLVERGYNVQFGDRQYYNQIDILQDVNYPGLTNLNYYAGYQGDGYINTISTEIRDINIGDELEAVFQKIGISADVAAAMAQMDAGSYWIDCVFGWCETEQEGNYYDDFETQMVFLLVDSVHCQMDFIDGRLVCISARYEG